MSILLVPTHYVVIQQCNGKLQYGTYQVIRPADLIKKDDLTYVDDDGRAYIARICGVIEYTGTETLRGKFIRITAKGFELNECFTPYDSIKHGEEY